MSQSRKTYSPMSHTYSYSSTLSPSYSYSRVSTYMDALQRDQQINKLKRQLTNVKSLEMRYYSLLQEISVAEKENRMLETKNQNMEHQYVGKIQQARRETQDVEGQIEAIGARLNDEEKKVEAVEREIKEMLELLKDLKQEEETLQQQNNQLETQVQSCNSHLAKLTQEQQQLSAQKSSLCTESKHSTSQMQLSMMRLAQLTQEVQKYNEELSLLQSQSECFSLECKNMETLCTKNVALIQNLQRKVTIQQGENQQLRNQLATAQEQWQSFQAKFSHDKQALYQNVIQVQEHSMLLKDTLSELDTLLQTDSTEKKYLKDICTKHALLSGQNEQIRELIKHLQETFGQKKARENTLIEDINRKLRSDESVKCAIQQRAQQMNRIKTKMTN